MGRKEQRDLAAERRARRHDSFVHAVRAQPARLHVVGERKAEHLVEHARAKAEIGAILDSAFADTAHTWELGADGEWTRREAKAKKAHAHQEGMMRRAQLRAQRARS
jgi:hypothetical protein